jgi:hypothetical protein
MRIRIGFFDDIIGIRWRWMRVVAASGVGSVHPKLG